MNLYLVYADEYEERDVVAIFDDYAKAYVFVVRHYKEYCNRIGVKQVALNSSYKYGADVDSVTLFEAQIESNEETDKKLLIEEIPCTDISF